jgi:hypothetical protein
MHIRGALLVTLTSVMLLGCPPAEDSDAADTDPSTDTDAEDDTEDTPSYDRYRYDASNPRVRFSHLMADVGGIDLVLGAGPVPLVAGVPFPGTVPYTSFPPADYDLHFNSTGTTDDLVFTPAFPAVAGDTNTLVLYGTIAGGGLLPALGPASLAITDDISAPSAGMARVRVLNLAGTTATAVGAAGAKIFEGATEVESVDYGQAGDNQEIEAGQHTWGVDFNGDDAADITFTFSVADGDTANVYLFPGDVSAGDPAVSVMFLHHTTSLAPDDPNTYYDEHNAIQVMPIYPNL